MSLTTVITRRNSWKESLGKIWGGGGGGVGFNKVHYGLSENDELHKVIMFNVQMVTVSQNYQLSIACEERIRSFTNLPIS